MQFYFYFEDVHFPLKGKLSKMSALYQALHPVLVSRMQTINAVT